MGEEKGMAQGLTRLAASEIWRVGDALIEVYEVEVRASN
jgi:hypothetical protein